MRKPVHLKVYPWDFEWTLEALSAGLLLGPDRDYEVYVSVVPPLAPDLRQVYGL